MEEEIPQEATGEAVGQAAGIAEGSTIEPIRNPQVSRFVNGVLRPVAEQLISVIYVADAVSQQALDATILEKLGITLEQIVAESIPEDFEDVLIDDGRIDQGIPIATRAKVLCLIRVIVQLNAMCKAEQYEVPEYVKKVAFDMAANPPLFR
jgi:hypothetical protein